MTLSLSEWLAAPERAIEAFFKEDGPVSRAMPGYVRNPHQIEYTGILARAAVRGMDPEQAGKVSPVEGDTGLGKSLGILAVAGITAILTGKKALVVTYTRHLNRQIAGKDGEIARKAVAEFLGQEMRIAVRRPRSAFASPNLCRREASLLAQDSLMESGETKANLAASSKAIAALGEWTEAELKKAANLSPSGQEAYAASFSGLVETFLGLHPELKHAINAVPYDHYTLDGNAKVAEQAAYDIYHRLAVEAHVLIATHAALIRSQSTFGNSLDPDGKGFCIVLIDEANRMEDAGETALGVVRSLTSYAREPQQVQPIASDVADRTIRLELADLALEQQSDGETLLLNLASLRQTMKAGVSSHELDAGDTHWVEILRRLHKRSGEIRALLRTVGTSPAIALDNRLTRRDRDIDSVLETIRRQDGARGYGKGDVPEQFRSHSKAWISFSPRFEEPSLQTRPKRGSKVISKLWENDDAPLADAIVVTSATLSVPGLKGMNRNASVLESIALTPSSPRINADLAKSVEMKKFGTLRGIVLAPPDWDAPTLKASQHDRREDGILRSPRWVASVGLAISDALSESWRPDGRSNVLVLCTSHADAELIGASIATHTDPKSIFVRQAHQSVDDGFDWLAGRKGGVLVTAGAWEGVDRPGLVDHLVIPALPFPAGRYNVDWKDKDGEQRYGRSKERMLIRLRQGIGRPFRSQSDVAKLWILDPRFGLPPHLNEIGNPDSQPQYLGVIPRRFERQLQTARIYDPAMGALA